METHSSVMVGVGLRHEHYFDAIERPSPIDFVEIHAENFFIEGGAVKDILLKATEHYQISIHATSLGLGSVQAPDSKVIQQLVNLTNWVKPILVSDHACFNRGLVHGKQVHTGDLLPLRYNQASLDILCGHVEQVQHALGRPLLIENLSAYVEQEPHSMSEFSFLKKLCEQTGCKLLLDLNNVLVNQYNESVLSDEGDYEANINNIMHDFGNLNNQIIGEIHLAGTTPVTHGELMIDDHANTVSDTCWSLYRAVVKEFGNIPTLIEWDQHLPTWEDLTSLALQAKQIQLDAVQ